MKIRSIVAAAAALIAVGALTLVTLNANAYGDRPKLVNTITTARPAPEQSILSTDRTDARVGTTKGTTAWSGRTRADRDDARPGTDRARPTAQPHQGDRYDDGQHQAGEDDSDEDGSA